MAVTAAMVKELREKTGAGMLECKNALMETDGDIEKATVHLREKGLAAAANKAGRIASEGIVLAYLSEDKKIGSVVEVNSETDFVAKNEEFRNFVLQVAKQASQTNAADLEGFLKDKWELDESLDIVSALSQKIAVIGENLTIRRFEKYVCEGNGVIVSYVHGGGKIAVMLEIETDNVNDTLIEAGRNIAMQIAALNPRFIAKEDVSADFIESEKAILKQQALNENPNKPDNVIEKMVEGRMAKELKEFCLLEQQYVKDGDMTVKKYMESVSKEIASPVSVKRFVRFETGEGLEKKQENFADEVSKVIKG